MAALKAANCEVAFDNLTRQLYATDASHYQIEPLAVAFPKSAQEAAAIIRAAAEAGTAVIPRGAGRGFPAAQSATGWWWILRGTTGTSANSIWRSGRFASARAWCWTS